MIKHNPSNVSCNVSVLFCQNFYRGSHKDLLANIAKEGKITEDVDAKLKGIVQSFLSSFTGA